MALPMALRASPMGQNHVNIQKVEKMVGKDFILFLLTTLICAWLFPNTILFDREVGTGAMHIYKHHLRP